MLGAFITILLFETWLSRSVIVIIMLTHSRFINWIFLLRHKTFSSSVRSSVYYGYQCDDKLQTKLRWNRFDVLEIISVKRQFFNHGDIQSDGSLITYKLKLLPFQEPKKRYFKVISHTGPSIEKTWYFWKFKTNVLIFYVVTWQKTTSSRSNFA